MRPASTGQPARPTSWRWNCSASRTRRHNVSAASEGIRDYYAILQVQSGADQEVIEAAYRQLMKKHHPDLAGDDPQRIAEHLARARALNEAYAALRDPEQRRRYD